MTRAKTGERVARALSLGLTLAVLWALLSGHTSVFIVTLGVLSVLLVVYLAHRKDVADHEGHPRHLFRLVFVYWPWLFWEIVKSSIAVSKLILKNPMPISPCVVEVTASQASEAGRVTYANSITLTPGTVTLSMDGPTMAIHAITRAMGEDLKGGDMDRRITALSNDRAPSSAAKGEA